VDRLLHQWPAPALDNVKTMSDPYATTEPPKVRITAGTAFKLGFFGALGLFVFYLIISIVFGIFAAIALAAGILPNLPELLQNP
jgi:hypothetical protein